MNTHDAYVDLYNGNHMHAETSFDIGQTHYSLDFSLVRWSQQHGFYDHPYLITLFGQVSNKQTGKHVNFHEILNSSIHVETYLRDAQQIPLSRLRDWSVR